MTAKLSAAITLIVSIVLFAPAFMEAASFREFALVNAFAKGLAITADNAGLETLYRNPAGLSGLHELTIASSYTSHLDNLAQISTFAIGLPLGSVKAAFSVPLRFVSDIPETTAVNGRALQTGSFSEIKANAIATLSASPHERIHVGINGNYYYDLIKDKTGSGFGLDAGVLLDLGYVMVGGSAENIGGGAISWSTGSQDVLSQILHLGLSTAMTPIGRAFADVTSQKDKPLEFNVGADVRLSDALHIEAGIQDARVKRFFSTGVRLILDDLKIDYAFSQLGELGSTHKIGIQYELH